MPCKYKGAEFPGTGIPGGTGKITGWMLLWERLWLSANITCSGRPSQCTQQLAVSFPGLSVSLFRVMDLLAPLDCESCFVSPEFSLISGKQQGLSNKCFLALHPPPQELARGDFPQQTTVIGAESDGLGVWVQVSAG